MLSRQWPEWVTREKKKTSPSDINSIVKQNLSVIGTFVSADGISKTIQCISFTGVFIHGDDCHKTEGCGDIKLVSGKSFLGLREATQEITSYLKNDVGVNVIEMYECEWERMKVEQPEIEDFIQTSLP